MLSYETLWAIDGMSEAKLSQLFREEDALPSVVLEKFNKKDLFNTSKIDDSLLQKVDTFLKNKIGNFSIVVNRDFQYPLELRKAKHPVEIFYYKGNLDLIKTRSVSIVGARKASEDGLKRARKLSREMVGSGFTVVSGLAHGIDTAAHASAIENRGNTVGVIGTPIDQFYPKENKDLQNRISRDHLLISHVPFYRYETESFLNHKQYFPRRNVTMASISEATIIVEASDTSGSLTQARACLAQNKKLFILNSCFENKSITWPAFYEKKGAIRIKNTTEILDILK